MIDFFFNPKSVAVIGASRDKKSAGYGLLKSLITGGVFKSKTNIAFKGKIYAVNPNAKKILGKKCYDSVLDIKDNVDIALIAVPAKIVPLVMKDCAKKRVKGVIIISAGFGETGEKGKELEKQLLKIAPNTRIIGPNCLGIQKPGIINATFGPCMAPQGDVAFFSQSGALIDSVIDWSLETNYGFSLIVSLGNKVDLDESDFLEYALKDKNTKSIALYLESIKDGKKFMRIAKKVSKVKPIVVLKGGKSEYGKKAISSHTGNIAGDYRIYEAAFKQSRVHIAENIEDLFEIALVLAEQPPCKNNIAIITNGGGAGVLCSDYCQAFGIKLAKLTNETIKKLDKSGKMHPAYSRSNPLDLVGDADHERYKVALDIVLSQRDVYGAIVIQTLQTMTEPMLDAKSILMARKKYPNKPIVVSYMGGKFSKKATQFLEINKVPDFNSPYKAARAMKALIERYEYLHS